MRARITERDNRVEHHLGAAVRAQAIAAGDIFTEPALIDETRTKETV
jgi:hypothetical protein